MGDVHTLPTAAPRRVKNPTKGLLAARWVAVRDGKLVRHPADYQPPWQREEEAQRARLAAAGIVRNAPTLILAAVLLSISEDARKGALSKLKLLAERDDGPDAAAALEWMRSFARR